MKNLSRLFLVGITLLFTLATFQNCSQQMSSQLASSSLGVSSDARSVSGFIAPTSSMGSPTVRLLPPPLITVDNIATDTLIVAKEYRHKTYDRYFYTTRAGDQQMLESSLFKNDWAATGNTLTVYGNQTSGSTPLCRFYNSTAKSHFYTVDLSECNQLKSVAGFVYEGFEGYAVKVNSGMNCPTGLTAVYRAYSNTTAVDQRRHRYVAGNGFINALISVGWKNEDISFCVPAANVVNNSVTPANTGVVVPLNPGSPANPANPPTPSTPVARLCTPGSTSAAGCPSVANGASVKTCNSDGSAYGVCIAECSGNYIVSGAVTTQPTCIPIPVCTSGLVRCGGAGFNSAQTEYSIDCGEDGYNYTRDTANGNWFYLGVGIIQHKTTHEAGLACCMNRDGSNMGCQTFKIDVIPTPVIVPPPPAPVLPPPVVVVPPVVIAPPPVVIAPPPVVIAPPPVVIVSPPPPIAAGIDGCPNSPVNIELDAAVAYARFWSGDWWAYNSIFSSSPRATYLVNPVMKDDSYYVIKLNVKDSDTTIGRYAAELDMSDAGPQRGGRLISVSKTKCDFVASSTTSLGGPTANGGGLGFSINESGRRSQNSNEPVLNLTTGTWYLNIHNMPSYCVKKADGSAGVCDVVLHWKN